MQPQLGSRALFPALDCHAYLSHCGISPWSEPVREALEQAAATFAGRGVGAFPLWNDDRLALREELALLVGSRSDRIALVPNVTAAAVAVANCYRFRPGDRVMLFRGEFPANVTPWLAAARSRGLKVVWGEVEDYRREFGLERLEQALREGLRLVAVSLVQFQTGLRMPIEEMARLCRRYGTRLYVDGIQAAGAMPIRADEWGVDFLAVGSHKWLMGPEACGFVHVSPEVVGELEPRLVGWLSHQDPVAFLFEGPGKLDYQKPFRPAPEFLESGSLNALGYAGLRASVRLLLELGPARISSISKLITTGLRSLWLSWG